MRRAVLPLLLVAAADGPEPVARDGPARRVKAASLAPLVAALAVPRRPAPAAEPPAPLEGVSGDELARAGRVELRDAAARCAGLAPADRDEIAWHAVETYVPGDADEVVLADLVFDALPDDAAAFADCLAAETVGVLTLAVPADDRRTFVVRRGGRVSVSAQRSARPPR